MLDTKLILVDGIPGSGKSTTAQWIALELQKRQIAADWFMDEHRGNPVTILGYADPDTFIARTLDNGKQLGKAAQSSHQIVVLEGCLLQHVLGRLLPQDIERDQIMACIRAVRDRIRRLNPLLIYFYQADIVFALKTIYAERGDEWAEYMLRALEQSPYAIARQLKGFEALTTYFQEYRAITDELLHDLELNTLAIENSSREWPVYREQILSFLSLSPIVEAPISRDYLARFEGRYRDLSGTHPRPDPECSVQMDGDRLAIYNFRYPRSNLIPKTRDEFYVETLGYELAFETDRHGQVSKMTVGGKEPGVGIGELTLLGREFHRNGEK